MKRLSRCRAQIDVIDAEILRLLSRRAKIAIEVGKLKRSSGLPYYSPERERDILARLMHLNPGPLQNQGIERMFRLVIRESLKVEKKVASAAGRD
jgi:chorismate mutase-like protein